MSKKGLWFFVEGNDDVKFIKWIINKKPKFKNKYNYIKFYRYAQRKNEKINNLIDSINSFKDEYLFITDMNELPCITARKQTRISEYKRVNETKIIVVKKEIESWFLAGLDKRSSKQLGIKYYKSTEEITKEKFNELDFDFRINFMSEILKHFSLDIAKQKNISLKYFLDNYIC